MKNLIHRILIYSIYIVLQLSTVVCSQTSELGEYEIYTRETSRTGIGYLSLEFSLPQNVGGSKFLSKGVALSQNYDIGTVVNEAMSNSSQFKLFFEGNISIGAAIGEEALANNQNIYPNSTIKYYVGTVEFFAVYLVPEFTQVINNGNALTITLGISLINLGGSFAYLDGGKLEEYSVGTANIIPFVLKPTLLYDFGTTSIGIQAYINPFNFLSYNYGSENLYPDSRGFKSKNSFMIRSEIRLIIAY